MIRVVINKEGDILLMVLANNKVEALMFQKMFKSVEAAQEKGVLERYFNADSEKLDPVYKEIIRLIYREEIPK